MLKIHLCLVTLAILIAGHAQSPVYEKNFESVDNHYKKAKGIKGFALDLSSDAFYRQPLPEENIIASAGDFSVVVWIKAPVSARQDYVILKSIDSSLEDRYRWQIGMQPNGAWYYEAWQYTKKDTIMYNYKPTSAKQSINDNKWHQLAFSFDTAKHELSFYYDGISKAIIHAPELRHLVCHRLSVGGNADGLVGEWETFNGFIDELKIFNTVLSASYIKRDYASLMPSGFHQVKPVVSNTFTVMNYNILHGGHETGKEVGVQRIVDIIKASGADIISMQETYGSGPAIADALGYYFYLRSTNLAVFSRYPIETSLPGGMPFNNGGVLINLYNKRHIAFFANWLNYPFDYWDMLEKKQSIDSAWWHQQQDGVNAGMLRYSLKCIAASTNNSDNVPVIFCGDFNTGSHLDWTKATRHLNNGYVMPFPATQLMQEQGYIDSYRQIHPDPLKDRGITWSPFFPTAFKDRIDYIYYKAKKIKPVKSFVISTHPIRYPSDHGTVVTKFTWLN